ncbi:MAG: hypothetical protein JXB15_11300 [Anaerolineales bacterium]|nr:hypothetical protein [Anaerolineales bacterium]
MPDRSEHLYQQAALLAARLERISADSIWARRASGSRGALLRWLEGLHNEPDAHAPAPTDRDLDRLQTLIDACYKILEQAARERLR